MAEPTYKVKTVRIPNLDTDSDVEQQEEEIEDVIKVMESYDYLPEMMAGGDNFAVIIFKKST